MKAKIKSLAGLCALAFPLGAIAGGTASGTVSNVFSDASFANVVYVTLSGVKTGNPACSSSGRGQFVIPVTAANDFEARLIYP